MSGMPVLNLKFGEVVFISRLLSVAAWILWISNASAE